MLSGVDVLCYDGLDVVLDFVFEMGIVLYVVLYKFDWIWWFGWF